jgi:hypothetical protein
LRIVPKTLFDDYCVALMTRLNDAKAGVKSMLPEVKVDDTVPGLKAKLEYGLTSYLCIFQIFDVCVVVLQRRSGTTVSFIDSQLTILIVVGGFECAAV